MSGTRFAIAAYAHPGLLKFTTTKKLTAGRQYELIRECVLEVAAEVGEPGYVGIEQPFFGFPKSAYMHGMVVARAEDACRAVWRHAPIRFFQPSEWRRACGVGGKATKAEVKEFVTANFGFRPANQDEADAAAVAVAMWIEGFAE